MSKQDQKNYFVTQKATRSNKYHTDRDCQYLDGYNQVDKNYVENRELELCKECSDDDYRVNGNHKKYQKMYIE